MRKHAEEKFLEDAAMLKAAIEAEREACAKLCAHAANEYWLQLQTSTSDSQTLRLLREKGHQVAGDLAEKIRSRR